MKADIPTSIANELLQSDREIERLRKMLHSHGKHAARCPQLYHPGPSPSFVACDCGFDDALAAKPEVLSEGDLRMSNEEQIKALLEEVDDVQAENTELRAVIAEHRAVIGKCGVFTENILLGGKTYKSYTQPLKDEIDAELADAMPPKPDDAR